MAVTINWNGDTTGLFNISGQLFKVSDRVFSVNELLGGFINYEQASDTTTLEITESDITDLSESAGVVFYVVGNWMVATTEGGTKEGQTVEKGTYFGKVTDNIYTTSLTLPNAEEIKTPLATIEYNGETIAQLNAGETATLSCEGKKMASDVVVKVNKIEEPVDDSIVGTWVFNDVLNFENCSEVAIGEEIINFSVLFEVSGIPGIIFGMVYSTVMEQLRYYNSFSGTGLGGFAAYEGEWINTDYKTIEIIETYDASFITWLKANATKQ